MFIYVANICSAFYAKEYKKQVHYLEECPLCVQIRLRVSGSGGNAESLVYKPASDVFKKPLQRNW